MKAILLIITIVNSNFIFCQLPDYSPAVEIFIGLEDASQSRLVSFDASGAVFGFTYNGWNSYIITHYYDHLDYLAPTNLSEGNWAGFDFVFSSTNPPSYDIFGFGLYKVTIDQSDSYFYLDYRDQRYGGYENYLPPSYGHDADIWIKYNVGEDKFYIKSKGSFDYGYPIINGSIQTIWSIKHKGLPLTNLFPDFWQNCLVLAEEEYQPVQIVWGPNPNQSNISKYFLYRKIDPYGFEKIGEFNNQTFNYQDKSIVYGDGSESVSYKVTSFNGEESTPTNIALQEYYIDFDWSNGLILTKSGVHPKLVWVPNKTVSNLTGYKIYRKVDDQQYYYIGSLGINTFTYIDNEVSLNIKESSIEYYVTATNGTQEDPTNTVTAIGDYNPHKEIQQDGTPTELKYFLSDNYPNPFNPSTIISFSIPEKSFVTLKVYDVLGREVAELVNEELQTGNFEKTFDASSLSSGVYIYRITAMKEGKILFNESKQMLMIK